MSVDRMKQLQRNTVTNADVIDGALVLKRYDGSRLSVDSGTSGVAIDTATNGSKAIQIEHGDVNLVLMASGDWEGVAIIGAGLLDDVENEEGPCIIVDQGNLAATVKSGDSQIQVQENAVSLTASGQFTAEAGIVSLHSFNGIVSIQGLPTADPHVADQLWNNAGVLKISAG